MAIVITGATGNVGRPLVAALHRAGAEVRAVTRRPDTAGFAPEVEVVTSVPTALRGASAVFLNSRALGSDLTMAVEAARREGVRRIVALSAINADDDFSRQPSRFRGDRNKEVEQAAVDSGLEWVSLRPTIFVSNFVGMWSPQIKAGDVVSGPYAEASNAPIVESDISEVAARALLTDELVGQKIALTGPEALTNAQLVAAIGAAIGRRLRYQEVPASLVRDRFIGIGFSTAFADAYMAFLSSTIDTPALVTHEVEKILGRPAKSFAQWAAEHKEVFAHDV
jgi:uncharacterized protein YbjT (DUF2867 family)